MSRISLGWRRPLQGLGVDFGSTGVKVVALGWDPKGAPARLSLLGAGREALAAGVLRDGVVRDPESAGAALRRLLGRLRIRCRLAGLALGGSSVFIKRLRSPSRAEKSEAAFREAVAREAARHVPFHIEALEFDYQRAAADSEGARLQRTRGEGRAAEVVFGAAPREMVRAHCDATRRGGSEAARIELEPYALFAAAQLAPPFPVSSPKDGGLALVEIGASRVGVHVFAAPPAPSGPGRETDGGPESGALNRTPDAPGDLLASIQAPGAGAAAVGPEGDGEAPEVLAHRIAATLREAIREAGLSPPLPVRLSGGGARLPGLAAALADLAAGDPAALDPLQPFGSDLGGAALAVAAGLALEQLSDLAAASNPRP